MKFDFFMPTKLITGEHCVAENAALLAELGSRCLIVTSGNAAKKSGALADLTAALDSVGVAYSIHDTVQQNPLLEDAQIAGEKARKEGAAFIVGIGGGSPLDASKSVAIYAANDIPLLDIYNMDWKNPPLPVVAIGTTAGTGSEITQYSVMTMPDGRKRTVSCAANFPKYAFGDSRYTATLPIPFTVSTGLDALSHSLEGYFSMNAGAVSDLFAEEAVGVLAGELADLRGKTEASQVSSQSRERLYLASVLAGFTLAQCSTTYCHSLGYFLSEERSIPHGAACAVYLPGFLRRQSALLPEKAERLFRRAGIGCEELASLIESLLPPIDVKLSGAEIDELVGRMGGNRNLMNTAPAGLSNEEAKTILTELFG